MGKLSALFALVAAFSIGAAGSVRAESQLELSYPVQYGVIPASTYDEEYQRVGKAHLVIEKIEDGQVKMLSESGFDGGARTVAHAVLAPTASGGRLRPVLQESRSFDPEGRAMGVLSVDHAKGIASCTKPNGSRPTVHEIPLPDGDRVSNVPMNLLFEPLVKGELETLAFQVMLCSGGARLVDFQAEVVRRENGRRGSLTEVRYGPDLGTVVSFLAQAVVPELSFWFDPRANEPWLGHRLPLYGDGPEVIVLRDGVPTSRLTE